MEVFLLRVSKEDKERWAKEAAARGLSLAAYIRMAVLYYEKMAR